jgi:cytochrome P450
MTRTGLDLTDPELYLSGDVHDVFAGLRRTPGLLWQAEAHGPGFWAVARYADALPVYRDTHAFTTTRGILLKPGRGRPEPGSGRMLVMTDPPRHTELRRVLNRYFSPRTVAGLEARLRHDVEGLLDRALAAGRCDFVSEVAARVPVSVICEMLGVPETDRARVHELTGIAFSSADPTYRGTESERMSAGRAHTEILGYFAGLLRRRRDAPGDDIVSLLATAEVDGQRLDDQEVLLDCDNLIVGGNETTRHAAAGGLLALLEHPGELAKVRADPGLLEPLVEEVLRWTSPATHILRSARRPVEVAGQAIRPGQDVVIWNISVNRDEAAFDRPHRFDVARSPNRHLALGVGEHFCLGAALARMELRVLFGALLARTRAVELAGQPERLRSNMLTGYRSLPVTLTPA